MVHKSQMANYFVNNPVDVVKVGQQVKVKVIDIDLEREKVSLSMKDDSAPQSDRPQQSRSQEKNVEISKKSESVSESTMKGNITFS
ncbi:MAG: S1 RNA-binding domain-containing protein [bacterium]